MASPLPMTPLQMKRRAAQNSTAASRNWNHIPVIRDPQTDADILFYYENVSSANQFTEKINKFWWSQNISIFLIKERKEQKRNWKAFDGTRVRGP